MESLKDAVEHRYYPPVFHYKVIQNHPKGCEPRKGCAYIKLTSTDPAVNIPVDIVDYGMNSYGVDVSFIYVVISNVQCSFLFCPITTMALKIIICC